MKPVEYIFTANINTDACAPREQLVSISAHGLAVRGSVPTLFIAITRHSSTNHSRLFKILLFSSVTKCIQIKPNSRVLIIFLKSF